METNKIAVGIIVLATLLALAVSGSTYDNDQTYNANAVYFIPEDSVVSGRCNETLVQIWTNTSGSIASGTVLFNYDQYGANITKFEFNTTNWEPGSSNAELTGGQVNILFTTVALGGRGPGPVHLGDLTLQCCSRSRCIINLTWDTAPAHSYLEDDLGDEILSVNWVKGIFSCVPLEPPNMISFSPSSPVTDVEGVTRTFTITMDQTVNISWQINGTEVKYNRDVTEAFYTNRSANIGTWNVSAIACNENGRVMQTWIWNVRAGVISKKTVYVDDDFTDDPANHRWDTIQEGVNDANDGDTVFVYAGTYYETVVLDKTITLIGDGLPTIDAHGSGDAINITADNCTVKGFCCVNAQPSPYAGIHVESCNNIIVENTCRNNNDGIYLSGTSNEIRNNIADYNDHHGIKLRVSSDNIIANNTARNNGNNGIYLTSSDNNRITCNDASNNVKYHGISLYSSNTNEIRNNVANYNHYQGIKLRVSSENIIANNTAKDNGNNGIYLKESNNNRIANNIANSNSYAGILCWSSSNNILTYNNLNSNKRGIRLYNYSTENIVANNTATTNSYGISVVRSSNNNIYLNNFVNNTNNAYSSNSNNIWHSKSKITYTYNTDTYRNYLGNYWSDYKGSDTDGDGIGDSSYSIDGDEDEYPLMQPWGKFDVSTSTPTEVYLTIEDDTCLGYEVYVDGVYQFTEGEDGTPDGYCAFHVPEGTHTIELRKNGYSTSATINFLCGYTYHWDDMPDYWCGESCEVYLTIEDDTCLGYEVYIDGVYQFTEGEDGTPDGYCAFHVPEGTHTIKLRKNSYSTSATINFLCGYTYHWDGMPDYWCWGG